MILRRPKRSHRSTKRKAFRRDVWRTSFLIGGLTGALALMLYFGTAEKVVRRAEFGFGQESRRGSILFMPLVGDLCRQSAFDNESGIIWPADAVSCQQAIARMQKDVTERSAASNIMSIGERFRK